MFAEMRIKFKFAFKIIYKKNQIGFTSSELIVNITVCSTEFDKYIQP